MELNNTFYRLPTASSAKAWVEGTPPEFVFTVKASRYLTHRRRLNEVRQGIGRFLEAIAPLRTAGRLGPILWQLPPDFSRNDERLAAALEASAGNRNAFEFRHPSWFTDEVYALLGDHGAALVVGDHPERPFQARVLTADWTLIRFHAGMRGPGGNYTRAEIDTWRRRIAAWRARAEIFAYFNNDAGARAPHDASRLAGSFGPPAD